MRTNSTSKTQQINKALLPQFSERLIEKKADYAFVLSPRDRRLQSICARLGWADMQGKERPILGHTTDLCTRHLPLFSGLEVKKHGGSQDEAQYQLALWLSSGVRKRQKILAQMKRMEFNKDGVESSDIERYDGSGRNSQGPADTESAEPEEDFDPEAGFTVVGSQWSVFIAYHDGTCQPEHAEAVVSCVLIVSCSAADKNRVLLDLYLYSVAAPMMPLIISDF
jgi:hypothetical protein